MEIKKHSQYDELRDRTRPISAFMDETLEDLLFKVSQGLGYPKIEDKDKVFIGIHNYLAGLQDGIRFDKPNPYSEDNPRLIREDNSSRIIGS